MKLEGVNDLREDIESEGFDFGMCCDVECVENGTFEAIINIYNRHYILILCEKHKDEICKSFNYVDKKALKNTEQAVLDDLSEGGV